MQPILNQSQQSPQIPYTANTFGMQLYDGWQDQTTYTIIGPVEGGVQHNIVITIERDLDFNELRDYADVQITALEQELKGCRMLKKGHTALADKTEAYEAIFSWWPTENLRIYQHQLYILENNGTAYKLTASFTKKTRKTIGPSVLRMMKSLQPRSPAK